MEDGSHLHELLEALESGALQLERDKTSDSAASIHRLFQSAHNLKSGLAMAGLAKASKLFHGLEDGLDDIRRGRISWSSGWADAVLDTVDRIRPCLDTGVDEEIRLPFIPPTEPAASPVMLGAEESAAASQAALEGLRLFRIEKLFTPGMEKGDFEGHLIYDDIRDSGSLLSVKPAWEEYSKADKEVVVRFLFSSSKTAEELGQLFFDPLIEVSGPPKPQSVEGFRILIIEDDPLTAEVVQKAVAEKGTVCVRLDGNQGAAEFRMAFDRGQPYDVIILDLEMPGADGHETLQALRTIEEGRGVLGLDRCLVFMNTSNTDLDKVWASFRLQADRYFVKPLSVEKIRRKLEDSLPWLEERRRGMI